MSTRHTLPTLAALTLTLTCALASAETYFARPKPHTPNTTIAAKADPAAKPSATAGDRLMFTTYFYTASEAIVHGYAPDTEVRIISLERGGTVWQGKVNDGEVKRVPTGAGVFSFVSDKKAAILVGTPSTCAVAGYWTRDRDGSFRSERLLTYLPSATYKDDERVIVWAWEDADVIITDTTSDKVIFKGPIKGGGYHEIRTPALQSLNSHTLDIRTTNNKKSLSVQVYYDQGFFVPASDGRAAGRLMRTYVGTITEGKNDLVLYAYGVDAKVKVRDINKRSVIWEGTVAADKPHTLTLAGVHVEITSDVEISASVAPYKHYSGPYQEHHYAAGQEGTGIESNLLLTTPLHLWMFSYYDDNPITVTDANTGKIAWEGKVSRDKPLSLAPGQGLYRVKSGKAISAMGGTGTCGAEYSPAGGMFKVDEALMAEVKQIKEERAEAAAAKGQTLSAAELAAPLSKDEKQRVAKRVKDAEKSAPSAASAPSPATRALSAEEVEQRLDDMVTY